jgi:hypothetical protein
MRTWSRTSRRIVPITRSECAVLAAARVTRRSNEARAIESILAILRTAGFSDADAVCYYHSFIDLVLGYSALDAAAEALDEAAKEADGRSWQDSYGRLSADTHPNVARGLPYLIASMPGSGFETALDLFLAALSAAALAAADTKAIEAAEERS